MGVGIIFFVVVAGIASVVLLMHRKAVRDSRRIGLPHAGLTASFPGGMWSPGKINADKIELQFFEGGSAWETPAWGASSSQRGKPGTGS
jgi:hypothetical protein